MNDDINRVNSYDSKTFTRNKLNTRVVVREKPFMKSRLQKFWEWAKPSQRTHMSLVDTLEMSKLMACIIFPVFMLLYWKHSQKELPEHWEKQFSGLQHGAYKEDNVEAATTDYFSIINDFEKRRSEALERRRNK